MVEDPVNVGRRKAGRGPCPVPSATREAELWIELLLLQGALDHGQRACRAAVIVNRRRLAGRPAYQPHLDGVGEEQSLIPSRLWIVPHEPTPKPRVRCQGGCKARPESGLALSEISGLGRIAAELTRAKVVERARVSVNCAKAVCARGRTHQFN